MSRPPKNQTSDTGQRAPAPSSSENEPGNHQSSVRDITFESARNEIYRDIRNLDEGYTPEGRLVDPGIVDDLNLRLVELRGAIPTSMRNDLVFSGRQGLHFTARARVDQLVERFENDPLFKQAFYDLQRNFALFSERFLSVKAKYDAAHEKENTAKKQEYERSFEGRSLALLRDIQLKFEFAGDKELLSALEIASLNTRLAEQLEAAKNHVVKSLAFLTVIRRARRAGEALSRHAKPYEDHRQLQGAYQELKKNLLDFSNQLRLLFRKGAKTTAPAPDVLKRSKSAFDIVAKKAAELAEDIKSLERDEREKIRALIDTQSQLADAVSPQNSTTELPEKAPSLWSDRSEHSGETSIGFFQRVYAPWLDKLHLTDISELDQPLYQALQSWRRRNKVPAHLRSFFTRQRRTQSEVDAELKKHKINKPEDAFIRFPNDKAKAQRLYHACRVRLRH